MKSFLELVKTNFRNLIVKMRHFEKGYPSAGGQIKMTGNHSDAETEAPPKKKVCVEQIAEQPNKEAGVRMRKLVMLLSYIGDNYYGMQRNPCVKTIEGELFSALTAVNAFSEQYLENPHKIGFQITARTDKHVSAVKQVVCLKMAANIPVESINEHLPEDIKVLSLKRVTKGFQCQSACSARIYSYTLPTFALAPEFYEEYPKNHRISQDNIQKVNDMLQSYVGTHNFHNFTSRKCFNDPSAKRYIIDFKAEEPFTHEDEEFITLKVKGQSFMLHQIRKMVGHLIAILKGVTPPNITEDVWLEQKFAVPMAPGLGLVLEDILFTRYDRKYQNDGIHEPLTFDEYRDELDNFRKKVLNRILKKEIQEKLMFNWLTALQGHTYVVRENHISAEDEAEVIN